MAGPPSGRSEPLEFPAGGRLDSWKEIASYLRRGARTVQRWEREHGLPVHRLAHGKQGQVFAYKSELDAWWKGHQSQLAEVEEAPPEPREFPWRVVALVVLAIWLVGAGYLAWRLLRPSPKVPAGKAVVLAVLPFENLSRDPEQEYFSDGLTEEMITQLARLQPGRLAVIARTSVMQYKRAGKKADQIGRELGADHLLEGTVRREGNRVRITAQLIRVGDQAHVWAQSYDRELSGILALQSEVAKAVTAQVQLSLTPSEEARLAAAKPVVIEAHEAYLKGRFFWSTRSPESLRKALGFFETAIEKDPRYAAAHAGMADAYILMEEYSDLPPRKAARLARQAAERALELDPALAEAHSSLGMLRYYHDWDWKASEDAFCRAIELNPSYVTAHHWYANLLGTLGRTKEARAEIERALRLDPLSPAIRTAAAWRVGAILNRSYAAALPELRAALDISPRYAIAHVRLALACALSGRREEGLRQVETALPMVSTSTPMLAELASVAALLGDQTKARELLAVLQDRARQTYVSSYRLALIQVTLGDNAMALKLLEKGLQMRDIGMVWLAQEPRLDPLRGAPRFQRLLRQMQLPALAGPPSGR